MVRFLLRALIFLASAAIGLLVAGWVVPGVTLRPWGFVAAVLIVAVTQAILAPFFMKMASRYASAFLGGVGLLSTLAGLILASLFADGISIGGLGSWVGATIVVWLVTALASVLLPVLVLKKKVAS